MSETYIPREQEGRVIIRIVTGYDKLGKPLTETRPAQDGEIKKLQEKNISFEILMKPEESEETDKTT